MMKLKIKNGSPEIESLDLDKIETDKSIKWVETQKEYFVEMEEKDGFLFPIGLYESPKSPLSAKVKFEVIYKSYALADFGLGQEKFEGESVDVEIRDNRIIVKG